MQYTYHSLHLPTSHQKPRPHTPLTIFPSTLSRTHETSPHHNSKYSRFSNRKTHVPGTKRSSQTAVLHPSCFVLLRGGYKPLRIQRRLDETYDRRIGELDYPPSSSCWNCQDYISRLGAEVYFVYAPRGRGLYTDCSCSLLVGRSAVRYPRMDGYSRSVQRRN